MKTGNLMHIKEMRERAGLTLRELSQKLEVSFTTVYCWDVGDKCPKPEKLPAIADALDCSIDALYGRGLPQ